MPVVFVMPRTLARLKIQIAFKVKEILAILCFLSIILVMNRLVYSTVTVTDFVVDLATPLHSNLHSKMSIEK